MQGFFTKGEACLKQNKTALQSTPHHKQFIRLQKVFCVTQNIIIGNKFFCLRHYTAFISPSFHD